MANSSTTSNGRKPRLERIYASFEGSVKAVYEDNTVLVLSAEGQSFTHVSPAGVKTVQLCDFCLSRFAPLLAELIDFRNQHIDVPALCRPFKQQLAKHGQLFQLGYPIADICWPSTPEEAFQQELVELPDKQRIAVLSKCSSARIVLEYTGLRFAVYYPLLIEHEPTNNVYTYIWQTQVFSRNQYPARWQPALAVASAVADNAAQGFRLQQQLLADLTNRPSSCRSSMAGSSCSSPVRIGSPFRNSSSSPVKRYGSPLQRQHKAWQQQQQLSESPGPPDSPVRCCVSPDVWLGSPTRFGSPSRLQQQQQQQPGNSPHFAANHNTLQDSNDCYQQQTGPVAASSTCTTQLPISDDLLHVLPTYQQQLRQQQKQQQRLQTSAGSTSSSKYAAALAQALGQRHSSIASAPTTAAAAVAGGLSRGWWLEPSLLLPSDELLQMVWTREATMVFVRDVQEVEVWLHADDSCLYSFQSGAFVTHLLPRSAAAAWDSTAAGNLRRSMEAVTGHMPAPPAPPPAAAAAAAVAAKPVYAWMPAATTGGHRSDRDLQLDTIGLVDGVVDAADMSRVYAATALPEMPVTTAVGGGGDNSAGGLVKVHVGQIAAAALKFRSTMARIKRCQATAGADSSTAVPAAATGTSSRPATALIPGYQQQHYQQQQTLSTDITEQQDVLGLGQFTAYADGRVRVLFADRTILNLTSDHGRVSLVMPDGSCRTVPAAKPLGVEQYVQAALEFAAWSSTSPEERAAALRLQALVAAELRSSARMAAICEWGSSHRLPSPAAAAMTAQGMLPAVERSITAAAALEYGDQLLEDQCDLEALGDECSAAASKRGGSCVRYRGDKDLSAADSNALRPGSLRDICGSGTAVGDLVGHDGTFGGPSVLDRQLAVEEMLQANARLLQRLQV